ncbi:hypothetical protein PROFUN_10510 [Planoprotostelium fungivorum]|uniref:DUF2470 domain-containing protein n=1 Tax=Planoprotostelium fungivorum TaxID=1890364 RepID=A0A2P6NDA4_9EUKA|nr:hypothetical protein PROFUN_10510 [Planoprotostelium fungivorum]
MTSSLNGRKHWLIPGRLVSSLQVQYSPIDLMNSHFRSEESPLFGSMMPYVVDLKKGKPLIALRPEETHSKHINETPKVSLLVYPLTPVDIPPTSVPVPRINLKCFASPLKDEELDHAKNLFIERHPAARQILQREKFDYYELDPIEVFFLTETDKGKPDFIKPEDYLRAKTDPLTPIMVDLIQQINDKFSDSLHLFPEVYADTEINPTDPTFVYSVDTLGFNLLGKSLSESRWVDFRLPFPQPLHTKEEILEAFESSSEYARDKVFTGGVPKKRNA